VDAIVAARQDDALKKLAPYGDLDRRAVLLTREVRELSRLPADERESVLRRVDDYVARCRREEEILDVADDVGRSRPSAGVGLALGLTVAAVAVSTVWWLPLDWPTPGLVGYAVAWIVAAPALGIWWTAGRQRRWLRTSLVPAIEGAGLDPAEAPAALQALERVGGDRWPVARRLAGWAADLRAVLEQDGRWPGPAAGR
jgi:hypothetical protein